MKKKTYRLVLLSVLLLACRVGASNISSATPTPTSTKPSPSLTPTPSPSATPVTPTPTPIPTSGQATILNGFTHYGQSGFQFASAAVVAWDSNKADVLAGGNPISFFLQFEAPPYNNPAVDKDAHSGAVRLSQTDLNQITECPESGYKYHWVPAKANVTYCIRTRDGEHYAKIKVISVGDEQIVFEWVYQPQAIRQFEE